MAPEWEFKIKLQIDFEFFKQTKLFSKPENLERERESFAKHINKFQYSLH